MTLQFGDLVEEHTICAHPQAYITLILHCVINQCVLRTGTVLLKEQVDRGKVFLRCEHTLVRKYQIGAQILSLLSCIMSIHKHKCYNFFNRSCFYK